MREGEGLQEDHMTLHPSLTRWALAAVCLISFVTLATAQTQRAEVHLGDDTPLLPDTVTTTPPRRNPVLFVHGHNLTEPMDADFNYRQNFRDPARPSFKQTLELRRNAWLDIEDYYIRFEDQGHSINEDALDIQDAIDLILHRHDNAYSYPHVAGQTTQVKVVIIAFSKGTLSSRLYLKNLAANTDYPFNPVSEFIAIAPPNHGIRPNPVLELLFGSSCASQQMMNGLNVLCQSFSDPEPCDDPFPDGGVDFITNLNGDLNTPEDEALRSRADTTDTGVPNPVSAGTLYVTLYANADRDFVGGDTDPGTCQSRPMARNKSPNAVNIAISGIAGNTAASVHDNTVHTADVICHALYAAAHHRSPRGLTCSQLVDGKPVVPRAAVMLTLDFSGSMSLEVCSGCATRAEVLKDAVTLFVDLWKATSDPADWPGDRLAATYFRTSVSGFPADNSLVLLDNSGTVTGDIALQNAGDRTAMGGGLQRSIGILKDVRARSPLSRIILFTDGMQNVSPMVRSSSSGGLFIDSNPVINLDQSHGIAIDTIGIGAGQAFVSLLEDISIVTDGRSRTTTDANLLNEFFTNELIDALRGSSPQLVAYRRGTLSTDSTAESFDIEDGVRRIVLMVNWKRGNSLDFSVLKDGVDVTPAGHFINGAFYKIFAMDLPARSIAARGNWQIRIKGNPATQYEAAAIVEGGSITYEVNWVGKRAQSGGLLNLSSRLTAGGRPVNGARMTVTLFGPTVSVTNLLAQSRLKTLPPLEPGMTAAELRALALAQDPDVLKQRRRTLVVKANDKGEFRTRFPAQVPGVYRAIVSIEGSDPKLGKFSRSETITTVVRFGTVDQRKTHLSCARMLGRRCVEILLEPRDSRGHLMGAGFSSAVSLVASPDIKLSRILDHGDGRYALSLETQSQDPVINLNVGGRVVFKGRLSKLRSR